MRRELRPSSPKRYDATGQFTRMGRQLEPTHVGGYKSSGGFRLIPVISGHLEGKIMKRRRIMNARAAARAPAGLRGRAIPAPECEIIDRGESKI